MSKRKLCLILNGKKADLPEIRQAVNEVRADGSVIDVCVTWENGDAARYAARSLDESYDVIVAGGGDGTVNEIVNGLFSVTDKPQKPIAVVPLGSANDFARGCGIAAKDPTEALRFAAEGRPHLIDIARCNDRFFVNAVVAGFGAEVTFQTSERLKKAFSGIAYGITGFLTALKRTVYQGHVKTDNGERDSDIVLAVLANGCQAGRVNLAPRAKLNDGRLELIGIPAFSVNQIPALVTDIKNLRDRQPTFLRYERVKWMEFTSNMEIPISPDGQELRERHARIDVFHKCLPFILPDGPLLEAE